MSPPNIELAGRVAIVTGAAGSLGGAIALELLKAGANVACVVRRRDDFRRVPWAPHRGVGRSFGVCADLRREADIRRMVHSVLRHFGRIDILVNNAAVRGPTAPVTKLSLKDWRQVLETNLTGPFLCARECLKHMARRREGKIINISSMAGRMAYPLRAAYASSKWGLIGLTVTLAQEAGPANVQVNSICPGPVEGPVMDEVITRRARALGLDAGIVRQQFTRATALGRMVAPEDVSRLVLFLCSQAARNITGQAVEVSAGYGLWRGS
ncbi:MAG: SDR family oxidoreductase [Acidobacteria bacterium]|nr:SDR family oxidoreductase [Acidobacteriota bacterium]